jgi:hypothetical protein
MLANCVFSVHDPLEPTAAPAATATPAATLTPAAGSTPLVSGVSPSGAVIHGSACVISGSGFGAKPQAAPAAFWKGKTADLDGLTLQQTYDNIIDVPSNTGVRRGREAYNIRFNPGPGRPPEGQFVAGFSYQHNSRSWFIQYWIMLDPEWHWGIGGSDTRWANTKIFRMWPMPDGSSIHKSNMLSIVSPSTDLCSGTEHYGDREGDAADPSNNIHAWPGTLPGTFGNGTDMVAASLLPAGTLCKEADLLWKVTTAGVCGASKPLSTTTGLTNARKPKIGDMAIDGQAVWTAVSSIHSYWTTDGTYGTDYHNVDKRITASGFYNLMTPGQWHSIQVEYQESSGNNMPDGRIHMWFDGKKVFTHDAFITCWAADGAEPQAKGPALIGFYDSWSGIAMAKNPSYVWLQDVYADTSWARVEIGDSPVYDSCAHRETQTPTSWSGNTVEIEFNQGSFAAGSTVYVFVVNESGVMNAAGFPVVIGG